MRLSLFFPYFVIPLVRAAVSVPFPIDPSQGRYVPGEYIIEYSSLPRDEKRELSPHDELYTTLRKRGISFHVKSEYYEPEIFIGSAVRLFQQDDDVTKIAEMPGVRAIRPVIRVPSPEPVGQYPVTDPPPPDSFTPHTMTGVDKAHAAGFTGEGIKIAIIDSGVDYNHPSLGNGIGPDHKIIGGFDFVGDNYTGLNQPVPDSDPLDTCNGHGTHVAGIIGANPGNVFNIRGVAHQSKLASYRIFGCNESSTVTDDVIVAAMIRAHQEGADILTLSIGSPEGWTESTTSLVASRIAGTGKVVTISAGNEGLFGSWSTSGPGDGRDVISIASVDSLVIPVQNATVQGVKHDPITYFRAIPLNITEELPIYATSVDVTQLDDACNPLPDNTPDLSKFLVVIHRGNCTFVQKLDNAAAKGGKQFIIYNTDNGTLSGIGVGNYQAVFISAEDGKFLVGEFVKKSPITIAFPQTGGQAQIKNPTGGLISAFSSYGPTFDMFFKPAIAAPGGNILSTLPLALGGFGLKSGTSMATPFIAGSAALILQAKGKTIANIRNMRDLLQSTASSVSSNTTGGDLLQTASQQGAGLIQVFKALNTLTEVTPAQLTLNDTSNFQGRQIIRITNRGPQELTYTLTHVPAGTAISITGDAVSPGPVPLTANFATVLISPTELKIRPGKTENVELHFNPPIADPAGFPVYSGFIEIKCDRETVKVTYMGVAASLKSKSVLDTSDKFFGFPLPALLDATGEPQIGEVTYTLSENDTPTIICRLNFGSPVLQVDLIAKQTELKVRKRAWWLASSSDDLSSFDSTPILGVLLEADLVPRNSNSHEPGLNGFYSFLFGSLFANGTTIPNGEYKILLRVLRVTGDPGLEEDYESWVSPAFKIDAAPPSL